MALRLHADRGESLLDGFGGRQGVVNRQHALHQVELELGNAQDFAQAVTNQGLFGGAIHVFDTVADWDRIANLGSLGHRRVLRRYRPSMDSRCLHEARALGAHADRRQSGLHRRQCSSVQGHGQLAFRKVKFQCFHAVQLTQTLPDHGFFRAAIHVVDLKHHSLVGGLDAVSLDFGLHTDGCEHRFHLGEGLLIMGHH
ncbi:hypothetical protein D9M73_119440 [compost metagenome]